MSVKYPIIAITGSSGAGTTSVRNTFEQIFRREGVAAAYIEGDAFHRYNRAEMRHRMTTAAIEGNNNYSHFGDYANLLAELESVFAEYAQHGTGRTRHYVHDDRDEAAYGVPAGDFTSWDLPVVCLATAHPAKFDEAVVKATGIEPERPAVLDGIESLPTRCEVMENDPAAIRAFIEKNAI